MNRLDFVGGVGVAAGLAILAAVLTPFVPGATSDAVLRLLVPLLAFSYVLYLLSRTATRVGRIVALALWAAGAAGAWLLPLPLSAYLLLHATAIWLIRSLYFHSNLPAAVCDLGLTLLGVAAAGWTGLHTGSLFLAVWTFFLAQALLVAIPAAGVRKAESPRALAHTDTGFERARDRADKALRRLYNTTDHSR